MRKDACERGNYTLYIPSHPSNFPSFSGGYIIKKLKSTKVDKGQGLPEKVK